MNRKTLDVARGTAELVDDNGVIVTQVNVDHSFTAPYPFGEDEPLQKKLPLQKAP